MVMDQCDYLKNKKWIVLWFLSCDLCSKTCCWLWRFVFDFLTSSCGVCCLSGAGGAGADMEAGDSRKETSDPADTTTLTLSGPPNPDDNDGAEGEEEEDKEQDPENDVNDENNVD